jgi:hypothetical protein
MRISTAIRMSADWSITVAKHVAILHSSMLLRALRIAVSAATALSPEVLKWLGYALADVCPFDVIACAVQHNFY